MDVEKLIRRLRNDADAYRNGETLGRAFADQEDVLDNAATALSTLQAENEKLRNEVERQRRSADDRKHLYENAERAYMKVVAELEQVKQERDAAVECIRGIAKSGRVWMCPYCVHAKDTTGGIAECELDVGVCMMPYSKFEWRGQQKED